MKYEYIYSGPPTRIDGIGNVETGQTIILDESHPFIVDNPSFVAFSTAAKQKIRQDADTVSYQELQGMANDMQSNMTGMHVTAMIEITGVKNRVATLEQGGGKVVELLADGNLPGSYTEKPHSAGGLNGIIDWIGKLGTGSFVNPHTSGELSVAAYVSIQEGTADMLVAKDFAVNLHTTDTLNGWWRIDFGMKRSVQPLAYGLGKATVASIYYIPMNWVFEASQDGSNWDILDTHTNDSTIVNATPGSVSVFVCNNPPTKTYRFVRWRTTGHNVGSQHMFKTGPVEVFGRVRTGTQLPPHAKGWTKVADGVYVPYY